MGVRNLTELVSGCEINLSSRIPRLLQRFKENEDAEVGIVDVGVRARSDFGCA